MIVHISAEAEHDLEAIGDYIARDNPARAISFLREPREQCRGLAEMPQRFPLGPRYEAAGVRRSGHGNIHILHGAQDYSAILFPD